MRSEGMKTLTVAAVLCIVCSILVSGAAVMLKPLQDINKEIDVKKNILGAAHLLDGTESKDEIREKYKQVQEVLINAKDGSINTTIDLAQFDPSKVEMIRLTPDEDTAHISIIPEVIKGYLIRDGEKIQAIVLPLISMGLWAKMFGFIALEPDGDTIRGLTYYQHGETPGLGAEVDNPRWKALWPGKKIYDEDGNAVVNVVKHITKPENEVDAISGATFTSKGVGTSLQYWFGEGAFKEFLNRIKAGEI